MTSQEGDVDRAVVDIDRLAAELTGRELPAGTWRVPAHEAWLTADALAAPPLPDGVLHPMYVWYAGARGTGYPIDHLFDLVECRPEDGPMLGETELAQHRPLHVGEELTVSSRILDLERKHGRSGTFDLMRVHLEVHDAAGELVGTVTNTFVYPRRSA
ncbi:MAG: hypothetical protein EA388_13520 [Nitriliruptor sp.]|nr:MAG: hypothetical protein EA388_13520 [Nitriliruptor sp.]